MEDAQNSFLQLFNNMKCCSKLRGNFLKYVKQFADDYNSEQKERVASANDVFQDIKDHLRTKLPTHATLESENIMFPTVGEDAKLNSNNTVHVDAFLYDEEEEEKLVEEGLLTRAFCRDCGSKNTEQFTFITHSCSQEKLEFMFTELVPNLKDKVLVDVGSRLGAILYGAYLLSDAERIIGVELNKELCTLQRGIVKKFKFSDRICVLEGDACSMKNVMKKADVIVLHNVFEWFATLEDQAKAWKFIHASAKKGARLLTSPPIEKSIQHLNIGINVNEWVREDPITADPVSSSGLGDEFHLYHVL